MIRIFTLDEFEPPVLAHLSKSLYAAFGVGAEVSGQLSVPTNMSEPYEAHALLDSLPKVHALADDKILFVTSKKLATRKLVSGDAPTFGLSRYGFQRAIVSTASLKNLAENGKLFARFAMQEVGHTFGLHHCLDPRCAMYPQWTPSYLNGDSIFCTYCRDSADAKIRTTKS